MLTKLFCKAQARLIEFKNDERGVTAIEYGLIAVAMAAALTVAFADSDSVISELMDMFDAVKSDLNAASTQS